MDEALVSESKSPRHRKEVSGFLMILGYLGMFMILIGFISLIPMIVVAFYPEEYSALPIFGSVAAANIVVGLTLFFSLIWHRPRSRFQRHGESTLLMLTWLCAILSGATPFFIAGLLGKMDMTFSAAFFESTSGYSTTGLTLFQDFIDVPGAFCPHVFTFHRAFTNFIGGVGLVLLVASVLGAGGGGVALYVSEGHSDRLLPNIAKTAKLIFGIYSFYTALGFIALLLAGMPVFDAICHSMSALSGGGFSPRLNNVASFREFDGIVLANEGGILPVNSLAIEIIVIVLVCLSAISFMLHTFLLRGRFRDFFRDDEIRYIVCCETILLILAFFSALIATASVRQGGFFGDSGEILRMTFFYTIGSLTNSGFASTAQTGFQFHIVESGGAIYVGHGFTVILIVLMLVGGGAGSSAGGIKQYRVAIAMRSIYYSLRYRFASIHERYPRLTFRYGETKKLDEATVNEANHYILLFIMLYLLLTVVMLVADPGHYSFETASFDMASAISNTGLSWVVGPAYAATKTPASFICIWAMSAGMLLGRLEIFPAAYAVANIGHEINYHHQQRVKRRRAAAMSITEEE